MTETQQPGFTLVPVGGFNAVCTRPDTGASIPVTNTALGFTVGTDFEFGVTCTVYNRAPNPPAEIVVDKQWTITDTTSGTTTTYADGTQPLRPPGRADPQRDSAALRRGPHRFRAGRPPVPIAETVTNGLRGCVLGAPTLVRTGNATNLGVPYLGDPGRGQQLVHAHQPGHLHHQSDPGQDGDQRQRRTGAADRVDVAAAGADAGHRHHRRRAPVTNAHGDRRHLHAVRVGRPNRLRPRLHGRCTAGTLTGNVIGVAAQRRHRSTCTINNNDQPAQLTLVKTVTNDNGGTAVPTAWTSGR